MTTFAQGTGSKKAAQMRTEILNPINWANVNNIPTSRLILGEFGIPTSSNPRVDNNYDPGWETDLLQYFIEINNAGLNFTAWAGASEWYIGLRAYLNNLGNNGALNYRSTMSSLLEKYYQSPSGLFRGVNYAGAEFSDNGPNAALNLSTTVQPGAGYYYPTNANWSVLASRGVNFVRVPYRWERVQKTLKGALDTTEMNTIKALVQAAGAAGISVMLDMHNYGRYDTAAQGNTTGNTNGVYIIGNNAPATHNGATVGGTMISCMTDFYTKFSTALLGTTGLWGYDIMNEPHDLPNGATTNVAMGQAAVEAIRAVDQNCRIAVEGYTYAGAQDWSNQNTYTNGSTTTNVPWLYETIPTGQTGAGSARNTDPKLYFEIHHYFDSDHSGQYNNTYTSDLNNTPGQYTDYSNSGYVIPSTGNTYQTGQRIVFQSTYDSASDFSAVNANTNTITFGDTTSNIFTSCLSVVTTSNNDQGTAHKSFTANPVRDSIVKFALPSDAVVPNTMPYTISHYWRDDDSTDLVQIRMTGVTSGYVVGLVVPSGSYTFMNTGATRVAYGQSCKIEVQVTDTAINLFLNDGKNPEATVSGTFTNVNIGGVSRGKFYNTNYIGKMFFDDESESVIASYYAPSDGGALTSSTVTAPGTGGAVGPISSTLGLMGFFLQ